jgi:uncharacterized membrane protein (DUF106 family)
MMPRPLVLLSALLLFGTMLAVPLPVSAAAASGLSYQLAQQCVFVVAGGPTVHDNLTITAPGSSSPQNISLSTLGVPTNVKVTVTPTSGGSPLKVDIAITAYSNASIGANPTVGVHAWSGLEQSYPFFTVRVVSSTSSESSGCNTVGLPLPESTVVVTLTSLGLGLLTQLVTRRFVDLNAERRMKAEVNAFNKEKRQATLAKDKAKLEKLKKRELPMRQAQSKVQLARTKVTFITIVPLFIIYYLMATFLGGYGSIVAVSPMPIPVLVGSNGEMVLFWWYILGSFTLSSVLTRLLHTNT